MLPETLLLKEFELPLHFLADLGEQFFFAPLRAEVGRYVFPLLAGSFRLVPAALGELAVVHGALALAAAAEEREV